eukprot:TRINITY_DN11414_c1_g2_i1.p1 TRINITY_DN11414_c1_g2~~TRINITY_DN11414_c1_g2_i1.p1  ORF type:complete len:137 (-),score=41.80 TRINITY_DN11414_c1_g2_i1:63-473(-)
MAVRILSAFVLFVAAAFAQEGSLDAAEFDNLMATVLQEDTDDSALELAQLRATYRKEQEAAEAAEAQVFDAAMDEDFNSALAFVQTKAKAVNAHTYQKLSVDADGNVISGEEAAHFTAKGQSSMVIAADGRATFEF